MPLRHAWILKLDEGYDTVQVTGYIDNALVETTVSKALLAAQPTIQAKQTFIGNAMADALDARLRSTYGNLLGQIDINRQVGGGQG